MNLFSTKSAADTSAIAPSAARKSFVPPAMMLDETPGEPFAKENASHYDPFFRPVDFYDLYPAHSDGDPMPTIWRNPRLPIKAPRFRLEGGAEDPKIARVLMDCVDWLRRRGISWVSVLAAPVVVVNNGGAWEEKSADLVMTWRDHPEHVQRVRRMTILISTNQSLADFRKAFYRMAFRACAVEADGVYGAGTVDSWISSLLSKQAPIQDDENMSGTDQLEARFADWCEVQNSGGPMTFYGDVTSAAKMDDDTPTALHVFMFHSIYDGILPRTIEAGANFFGAPRYGRSVKP